LAFCLSLSYGSFFFWPVMLCKQQQHLEQVCWLRLGKMRTTTNGNCEKSNKVIKEIGWQTFLGFAIASILHSTASLTISAFCLAMCTFEIHIYSPPFPVLVPIHFGLVSSFPPFFGLSLCFYAAVKMGTRSSCIPKTMSSATATHFVYLFLDIPWNKSELLVFYTTIISIAATTRMFTGPSVSREIGFMRFIKSNCPFHIAYE